MEFKAEYDAWRDKLRAGASRVEFDPVEGFDIIDGQEQIRYSGVPAEFVDYLKGSTAMPFQIE